MPNFAIAVSGLEADSTALNTIANNLSNMNTTGFKSQTTSFSDALYQEIGSTGSGDEIQVGTGTNVATNTTDFSSGTISTAASTNDVAIDGTGFFVLDNSGSQLYTQNGSFQVSSTGKLESTAGLGVMGYSATNNVVNTSGALTDITIPTGSTMAASTTTSFGATQTLDSAAVTGATATTPITVYDSMGQSYTANITYTKSATANEWTYNITLPETLTPATTAGTSTVSQVATYNFGSASDTVDAKTDLSVTVTTGGTSTTYTPTLTYGVNTATGATGTASSPAAESLQNYVDDLNAVLNPGGGGVPSATGVVASVNSAGTGVVLTGIAAAGNAAVTFTTTGSVISDAVGSGTGNATGTLSFDTNGNLTSPGSNLSGITFSGLSDGATIGDAKTGLTWDLFGSSGSSMVTQTASASTTGTTTQNGYAGGTYEGFGVGTTGLVTANYSNGQTETVGQIAVATINNEQGLQAQGASTYSTTTASGSASLGVAGTGGRGTLEDSALEASNVDISAEFSDLIVAQRAFEANSKAITTFDTVTQQAIGMIH